MYIYLHVCIFVCVFNLYTSDGLHIHVTYTVLYTPLHDYVDIYNTHIYIRI